MSKAGCMCNCDKCTQTQKDLARWRLFLGSNPELLPWRAAVYLIGKKAWENAAPIAIMALCLAIGGGALPVLVWLVGWQCVIAFVSGVFALLALIWVGNRLDSR